MHQKLPSDIIDLAEAAGYFNGEGFVGCYPFRNKGKSSKGLRISVNGTHRPNVERFQYIIGGLSIGNIVYVPPKQPHHLPLWQWQVSSFEKVQYVVALLWFRLSKEKRADAQKALLEMREYHKTVRYKAREWQHGTISGKTAGCNCRMCLDAWNIYQRARRRDAKQPDIFGEDWM